VDNPANALDRWRDWRGPQSATNHGSVRNTMIFELNKDQLTDPDKIKAGQVKHLP
jgi:hypothetical protein